MTDKLLPKSFKGGRLVEFIQLILPTALGILSLIISLYTYKVKAEIRQEFQDMYVKQEVFNPVRDEAEKSSRKIEEMAVTYVQKSQYDSQTQAILDKINERTVAEATLTQEIRNLENLLKNMREDIRSSHNDHP